MTSPIPTSTSVKESAVIEASFSDVWHLIKIQDFGHWWSKLSNSEFVKGASPDTDIVRWTFKDGTVLEVKQEEHSVSDLERQCPHSGGCSPTYSASTAAKAVNSKRCGLIARLPLARQSIIILLTASSHHNQR
jgi:hypothetical protein